MKWKFYSLAFVAGMSILTACSSDDNNDNDGNGGNGNGNEIENGTILKGTITSDVTLAADDDMPAPRGTSPANTVSKPPILPPRFCTSRHTPKI